MAVKAESKRTFCQKTRGGEGTVASLSTGYGGARVGLFEPAVGSDEMPLSLRDAVV